MATLLETTREFQVLPYPSIPGYDVLEEIGRGGMGVVYRARQLKLGRLVALKVLLPELAQSPDKIARFQIEASAVARLQHPNIVQIFEVGEFDGRPFIALELVEGGNLAEVLGTPWPPGSAVHLVEQLARAVHFAHEHGIVHRDLKPANILLQKSEVRSQRAEGTDRRSEVRVQKSEIRNQNSVVRGQKSEISSQSVQTRRRRFNAPDLCPKIVDFGLAKLLDEDAATTPRNWQTQVGIVLGSPPYMAPEQAAGRTHEIGPATDIHALGMIFYEMITGRAPFRGTSVLETLELVKSQVPIPPSKVAPGTRTELDAICLKCLEKNPRKRYATAHALADDLAGFRQSLTKRSQQAKTSAMSRARRHTVLALQTFLAIISALGSVLTVWQVIHAKKETRLQNLKSEEVAYVNGAILDDHNQSAGRTSSLRALNRGLAFCGKREVDKGMLWFARGLKEAAVEDQNIQQLIRTNMAKWRSSLNTLLFLFPTSGQVDQVGFSADGKIAFTLCHVRSSATKQQTKVHFWNLITGQQIYQPIVRNELVTHASLSPDGTTIVLGGPGNSVWLFNVRTGQPLGQSLWHNGEITCLSVSNNSQLILTGSAGHTGQIWNTKTGQPVGPQLQHQSAVTTVAFSPDSTLAATASEDGIVRLWDTSTSKSQGLPMKHNGPVRALAFGPNGHMLLTGSDDRSARLWDTSTGRQIGEPFIHGDRVLAVAFSSDGKRFASGSADRIARIWKTGNQKPDWVLSHSSAVKTVQFSSNSRKVLATTLDFTAQLWDVEAGKRMGVALSHPDKVMTANFSPDGTRVLASNQNGWAKLWEIEFSHSARPDRPLMDPDFMTASVEQIVSWVEQVTGTKIDSIPESDSDELFAIHDRDN